MMTQPIWLSPSFTVDDVAAGLVTAATWWNRHDAIPARIERVEHGGVDKGSRGTRWRFRSVEQRNGSERRFYVDAAVVDDVPMSGAFGLFVGAALLVDEDAEALKLWDRLRDDADRVGAQPWPTPRQPMCSGWRQRVPRPRASP